jgi:MoaA/NifB/PqqE/SkfB family radical SAM enzyme
MGMATAAQPRVSTAATGASPFAHAPFIVIWEVTRACALACVHCRAEAIPHRHPDELTTEEGKRLLDRVAEFGPRKPLFVLTGGDPLRRRDVAELVRHGVARGLSMALTPSGTAAVTRARLEEVRDAGLARLAVSLDGSTPEAHDAFRRVRGSHRFTMRIIDDARALGLPLQINTTVSRETVDDLPAIAEVLAGTGAVLWALFFLIPVGRANATQALAADEIERVLAWAAARPPRARGARRPHRPRPPVGGTRRARRHRRQRLPVRRPRRRDLPQRLPPARRRQRPHRRRRDRLPRAPALPLAPRPRPARRPLRAL